MPTRILIVALLAAACAPAESRGVVGDQQPKAAAASTVPGDGPHLTTPAGEVVTLEIARSDAQRARGLMFRESLPEGHGMLFVFAESEMHGFWMKNTFIALDMLWLDAEGTITDLKRGVPPCSSDPCPTYVPDAPGLYVLELTAGEIDRLGLRRGDRLELRNIGPPPKG